MDECIRIILSKVDARMNEDFIRMITDEEIKRITLSFVVIKPPESDGYFIKTTRMVLAKIFVKLL